jgi:hypothetical protein
MLRASWKPRLFARTPQTARKAPRRCRPQLEALEIRLTPAPLVVTGAAVINSSGTGATLSGTVNPQGLTTTALFQYSIDPTFTPTLASTIASGFDRPQGVAVDAYGDVFVADTVNHAVKKVLPNGTIRTIASGIYSPTCVAVDAAGDVFFNEYQENAV